MLKVGNTGQWKMIVALNRKVKQTVVLFTFLFGLSGT